MICSVIPNWVTVDLHELIGGIVHENPSSGVRIQK